MFLPQQKMIRMKFEKTIDHKNQMRENDIKLKKLEEEKKRNGDGDK